MTQVRSMTAAAEIAAKISHMTAAEKKDFLADLSQNLESDISAAEAKESKTQRLDSLRAAREKARVDLTTKNSISWIDGLLKRHGAPTIEEIAAEGPAKLDSLLASAANPMAPEIRMTLKTGLHHLGLC
jgi:hypothetical protein